MVHGCEKNEPSKTFQLTHLFGSIHELNEMSNNYWDINWAVEDIPRYFASKYNQ